jgi:Fe-S-cluster containining protein
MREIEKLKESILKEYPRLNPDSEFTFRCHPGVPCFNACCADVNIFLTPYDVLRLKHNLGITSEEFLSKYTISPFDINLKYPVIMLKMNDDEKKTCPFVAPDGCTVYEDRPWACRMYPLGLASPGKDSKELEEEFYFLLEESMCRGFDSDRKITVSGWLDDQGINEYNEMGEHFKELTTNRFFTDGGNLPPEKMEMFFTAVYNLDRFRKFLFDSTFFDKFEVDDEIKSKIKDDDVELLNFGYQWIKFALLGEKTLKIKTDVAEAKKKELAARNKLKK